MRRQLEGSRAIAETVARCRPAGRAGVPDHPTDAHRRGRRRHGDATAGSRRASSSPSSPSSPRCRRPSARRPPARAPTRPPPARACCSWPRRCHNASGLGLPIVMTVANRAIGAPINIWNDHSDAMSQRDCGWVQLYAPEQPGGRRPARAGLPRWQSSCRVPVMVCMDGFVLTHAFEAIDVPGPADGRRVPAAVRAAAGARPGRAGDDRRDGRARGLHRGPLPDRRPVAPRADLASPSLPTSSPQLTPRSVGLAAASGYRLAGARTVVLALGSVVGTVAGRRRRAADARHRSVAHR